MSLEAKPARGGIGARIGAYLRAIVREELARSAAEQPRPEPPSLQPLEDRMTALEGRMAECLAAIGAAHQTVAEVRHERNVMDSRLDRAHREAEATLRRLRDQVIAVLGLHTSSVEASVGRAPDTGMGRFAAMLDGRLAEMANETGKLESAIRFTYEISDRVVRMEEQVLALDSHAMELAGRVLEMDAEFRALRGALETRA